MFSMQSVSENPSKAMFQLSSAASLNLERSQNGVLGKGLKTNGVPYVWKSLKWCCLMKGEAVKGLENEM